LSANRSEEKTRRDEVVKICKSIEEHEMQTVRTEMGDLAVQLRKIAEGCVGVCI
jgi:hypothetical protein